MEKLNGGVYGNLLPKKMYINNYKYISTGPGLDVFRKLKFYKRNNISIKFRLAFKQEYEFKGKLIQLEEPPKDSKGDAPAHNELEEYRFEIELENGDKALFYYNDVDPLSICPASYNPISFITRVNIPEELRTELYKRDDNICQYQFDKDCTKKDNLTLDHIQPMALGGLSIKTNLITACGHCNNRKWKTPLTEFLGKLDNPRLAADIVKRVMKQVALG